MKKLLIICFLFVITSPFALAKPELKIEDRNLKCFQNSFSSIGYDECKLKIKLRINDYQYLEKYNKLQYNITCSATFEYFTAGSFSYTSLRNQESNNTTIYGTNKYNYLDITTHFYSLQPVTQVKVSELTCKVKNIY